MRFQQWSQSFHRSAVHIVDAQNQMRITHAQRAKLHALSFNLALVVQVSAGLQKWNIRWFEARCAHVHAHLLLVQPLDLEYRCRGANTQLALV